MGIGVYLVCKNSAVCALWNIVHTDKFCMYIIFKLKVKMLKKDMPRLHFRLNHSESLEVGSGYQ